MKNPEALAPGLRRPPLAAVRGLAGPDFYLVVMKRMGKGHSSSSFGLLVGTDFT